MEYLKKFTRSNFTVKGSVAPGYESVREMFEEYFKTGLETRAQVCVYVDQERVIDLYGTIHENDNFGPESLIPVFSSSKVLTSIVIALLVDNEILDYDEKISDIWPEFAKNGKEEGTVRNLMQHELGLPLISKSLHPRDFMIENIRNDHLGRIIEKESYKYSPGEKCEYHFISRGIIANEIVRRVDPKGRTIGEILRYHISEPLEASAFIGLKQEELKHAIPVDYLNPLKFLMNNLSLSLSTILTTMVSMWMKGEKLPLSQFEGVTMLSLDTLFKYFNSDLGRSVEMPSANANCSARGLALIGAAMANKGKYKDIRVLSKQGWAAMHDRVSNKKMFEIAPTKFSQGGVNIYQDSDGSDSWVGWMGLGGSMFQWHPHLNISFAFVPSYLDWSDMNNSRAAALQENVLKCAKNNKS